VDQQVGRESVEMIGGQQEDAVQEGGGARANKGTGVEERDEVVVVVYIY
jgi:hypothetical protein